MMVRLINRDTGEGVADVEEPFVDQAVAYKYRGITDGYGKVVLLELEDGRRFDPLEPVTDKLIERAAREEAERLAALTPGYPEFLSDAAKNAFDYGVLVQNKGALVRQETVWLSEGQSAVFRAPEVSFMIALRIDGKVDRSETYNYGISRVYTLQHPTTPVGVSGFSDVNQGQMGPGGEVWVTILRMHYDIGIGSAVDFVEPSGHLEQRYQVSFSLYKSVLSVERDDD